MDSVLEEAARHLMKLVVLCQVSRDSWSESDHDDLREARKFIGVVLGRDSKKPEIQINTE